MDERLDKIPVLHCRGTHRTVGFIIGRQFKSCISDLLENWSHYNTKVTPAYETDKGRELYDRVLCLCRERFPNYVNELEGMAEGAIQPFHKIILGHSEDAGKEFLNNIYIVVAEILGEDGVTVEEKFTTLSYPGHLPGYTMGWNSAGLVHSVNTLYPSSIYAEGTPRAFLARALLKASTVEDVLETLRDAGIGAADGVNFNLIWLNANGSVDGYHIEVAPPAPSKNDQSQLDVIKVPQGVTSVHCNKYLRLPVDELQSAAISSGHRHNVIRSYHEVETRQQVKNILSDTSSSEYPIFRNGAKPDYAVTLVVGIFDLRRRTWSLYKDLPTTSSPVVVLPMNFDI